MMKVAFVSFDFGEYCIRLASALGREVNVLLLLPHQLARPYLPWLIETVRFHPFEKPRLRQPFQQLRTAYALVQQIRQFDPDVIHFQRGHLWFNCALPLLRRYPLVITIHDPRHHLGDRESQKTPQMLMDFGYHRADQVIVHGTQLKQVVVEQCGLPEAIVHVIPHIVLGDEASHSDVQEDGHLLLFFGRIWEYKGLEYLIRAEPLITAQVPQAKILIAGLGEDFARYRRMMVHPDRFIVYNEYIPDDKRDELFRQASVVVLPYIDASVSGVIPLAYTFAKPVVATRVGTLPEMVEHGRTGFLVPPRDETALADAIIRLLRDSKLRSELGKNGKLKIDTECSANAVAERTLLVYRCAINSVQSRYGHGRTHRPCPNISEQQ